MEYDQRVIITFLWNERADARDIADRLQSQCVEHVYQFQTIRFYIAKAWLDRQDLNDEIRTGRSPLGNLDSKLLAMLDKCRSN
jgi:hypothetical protein